MFNKLAGPTFLCVVLLFVTSAEAKVEWRNAKTVSGTIVNTSTVETGTTNQLPQNGKLPSQRVRVTIRPVKIDFQMATRAFRVKWETEATQERQSQMRIILYRLDKRGNRETWRKAGTLGRVRGGQEGEKILTSGEGQYYLELTGSNIKYAFTIEEAHKAGSSSSAEKKE